MGVWSRRWRRHQTVKRCSVQPMVMHLFVSDACRAATPTVAACEGVRPPRPGGYGRARLAVSRNQAARRPLKPRRDDHGRRQCRAAARRCRRAGACMYCLGRICRVSVIDGGCSGSICSGARVTGVQGHSINASLLPEEGRVSICRRLPQKHMHRHMHRMHRPSVQNPVSTQCITVAVTQDGITFAHSRAPAAAAR